MKVAYLYLPGRIQKLPLIKKKECPTEFFYGAIELVDRGHEVGIFEATERPRKSLPKFAAEKIVKIKYLPPKTYVGIIDAVGLLIPKLTDYDIIIGTTSDISFSLGIWRALGILKKNIIGIQCGILNYRQNPIRKKLTRRVLKEMYSLIFGYGELEGIKKTYDIGDEHIDVNLFGVDTEFWRPGEHNRGERYVLSVGNDARRDFDTLAEAARSLPEVKFVIITKRKLSREAPDNVTVLRGSWGSQEIDDIQLRRMYRQAACVVVPLKQTIQPSGQSVALQAMACGKAVVLTRTTGLWETENLIDDRNIKFVQPGDPGEIRRALSEILESSDYKKRLAEEGRKYVVEGARITHFAKRIEDKCRMLMSA